MTPTGRLEDRIAGRKRKMREILGPEDEPRELTDENRTELRHLAEANDTDTADLELLRHAYDDGAATTETADDDDFDELRHACKLTNFLDAAMSGRALAGPERELATELRVGDGHIPTAIFDAHEELRHNDEELRADTVAPNTGTGVNVQPIRPFLYAPSVSGMLNIDMPTVGTGDHAEPRITTALSAGFEAAGDARAASAAVIGIETTSAKRISARLEWREEDRLRIGTDTWESALRSNLQMAMSNELNHVLLQAAAGANEPDGLVAALTAPGDPAAVNDTFDGYITNLVADQIDGIHATTPSQLRAVTNDTVLGDMLVKFRDNDTDLGSVSIWDYIDDKIDSLVFNDHMPDEASNISLVLVHRIGRTDVKLATMPVWGSLSISDIYTGSAAARTSVTLHQFCGDVMLLQPAAYALAKVKTA